MLPPFQTVQSSSLSPMSWTKSTIHNHYTWTTQIYRVFKFKPLVSWRTLRSHRLRQPTGNMKTWRSLTNTVVSLKASLNIIWGERLVSHCKILQKQLPYVAFSGPYLQLPSLYHKQVKTIIRTFFREQSGTWRFRMSNNTSL